MNLAVSGVSRIIYKKRVVSKVRFCYLYSFNPRCLKSNLLPTQFLKAHQLELPQTLSMSFPLQMLASNTATNVNICLVDLNNVFWLPDSVRAVRARSARTKDGIRHVWNHHSNCMSWFIFCPEKKFHPFTWFSFTRLASHLVLSPYGGSVQLSYSLQV